MSVWVEREMTLPSVSQRLGGADHSGNRVLRALSQQATGSSCLIIKLVTLSKFSSTASLLETALFLQGREWRPGICITAVREAQGLWSAL